MSKPPLWKAMDSAAYPKQQPLEHNYRAAEIRAVRDWLVPEEEPCPDMAIEALLRDDRQRLRVLLTAEAERAEQQP